MTVIITSLVILSVVIIFVNSTNNNSNYCNVLASTQATVTGVNNVILGSSGATAAGFANSILSGTNNNTGLGSTATSIIASSNCLISNSSYSQIESSLGSGVTGSTGASCVGTTGANILNSAFSSNVCGINPSINSSTFSSTNGTSNSVINSSSLSNITGSSGSNISNSSLSFLGACDGCGITGSSNSSILSNVSGNIVNSSISMIGSADSSGISGCTGTAIFGSSLSNIFGSSNFGIIASAGSTGLNSRASTIISCDNCDTTNSNNCLIISSANSKISGKSNQVLLGINSQTLTRSVGPSFQMGNGTAAPAADGDGIGIAFYIQTAGTPTSIGICTANSFVTPYTDYGEYFEWEDGNTLNEDRRGLFVTFSSGPKIKICGEEDVPLGVVTQTSAVMGGANELAWGNAYLRDKFNQAITEYDELSDYRNVISSNTNINVDNMELINMKLLVQEDSELYSLFNDENRPRATKLITNPDYDPAYSYTPRKLRKEWTCVGLLGQLVVLEEVAGACVVGTYVNCNLNGKVIPGTKYRVIGRVSLDTVIIFFRGTRS